MNEWLEKRKFICRRCEFDDEYCTERANIRPEQWFCPKFRPKEMWEDDLSASMFEARVAAKLAEYCANYWQYQSAWHALKQARIEVEQEFYK